MSDFVRGAGGSPENGEAVLCPPLGEYFPADPLNVNLLIKVSIRYLSAVQACWGVMGGSSRSWYLVMMGGAGVGR